MPGAPFVSLVIPACNEALRLEASVMALREYLGGVPWTHEVILVVERSTDGTLDVARRLLDGQAAFEIIASDEQRGKGHAVRTGMLRARGEIAFFMDCDLSTPLAETGHFLAHFAAHPETAILVGNRQHERSVILKKQGIIRRNMGRCFNAILRRTTGIRLRDTQCGFKAFRRPARQTIFPLQRIEGFAFDVEILLLAEKHGFQVADLPVEWTNFEDSKVHILRDSFRMLMDALRIRRMHGM